MVGEQEGQPTFTIDLTGKGYVFGLFLSLAVSDSTASFGWRCLARIFDIVHDRIVFIDASIKVSEVTVLCVTRTLAFIGGFAWYFESRLLSKLELIFRLYRRWVGFRVSCPRVAKATCAT